MYINHVTLITLIVFNNQRYNNLELNIFKKIIKSIDFYQFKFLWYYLCNIYNQDNQLFPNS